MKKELFPYQRKAHSSVVKALKEVGKALMIMATGLGKTVVSAFVLKSVYKSGNKVLFLCHDNYILKQARKEYRESFDPQEKLFFYNFFESVKDINRALNADICFGSFQSMNSKSKWYLNFNPDHFDFVIVDESHHGQAKTFSEVINYFSSSKKLGMTATPDRMDGLDIRDLFGEPVVDIPLEEGIANGWLTNVEYHVLSDGLNEEAVQELFKEVVVEGQRVSVDQINQRLFVKKRDEKQIEIMQNYTENWTKKCLTFCENIEHINSFSESFTHNFWCTFHSKNSTKVNDNHLHDFIKGRKNPIITVDKFNEGQDIPDVEVLALMRRTASKRIFYQQLGRGLRKTEGKTKVTVLDFVSNVDHVLMVHDLVKRIEKLSKKIERGDTSSISIHGNHFSFEFSDTISSVIEILRISRNDFYSTWQEASGVVINLQIKSKSEYLKRRLNDKKLCSAPNVFYKDFPGWNIFFGRKNKDFYKTWKKASKVVIKLGIKSMKSYKNNYKKDIRLHSHPQLFYSNFPGSNIFFGRKNKDFYKTWEEASKVAVNLGIKSLESYKNNYKKDIRLPSNPQLFYSNFPGSNIFFGRKNKDF